MYYAYAYLIFYCHDHEVIELVHAVGVEPHDGGVSQLVEHGAEDPLVVESLVLQEDLLDELPVEHGGGDVVQDYPWNIWRYAQL